VTFQPTFCPCSSAQCESSSGFQYQRRGRYTRVCDGRSVQRFQCNRCKRTFSTQTFRVDRGLHKPHLDDAIFRDLVSKVTQRQIARNRGCNRKSVARRNQVFGKHCRSFHERALRARRSASAWPGRFLLDELETYEQNRRLKPITVPLLVHKQSHFIVHVAVGTLPARKPLSEANQRKLDALEKEEGKRRSQSREKVSECFEMLKHICPRESIVTVATDEKHAYRSLLKRSFGARVVHETTHSTEPRSYKNPLFVVNHTFAMLRDGLSRLVRRNWAASKEREKLKWHLWLYSAWRNYVRPITNQRQHQTAAMAAGVFPRMLEVSELLQWRIFDSGSAHGRGPESL
jgi:transposase-like protein